MASKPRFIVWVRVGEHWMPAHWDHSVSPAKAEAIKKTRRPGEVKIKRV